MRLGRHHARRGSPAPASGSGSGSGDGAGREWTIWGDGGYGVVLAHGAAFDAASWEPQATVIAEAGNTVVAVEDISPDGILAAVEELGSRGIERVALVGASAGADSVLRLAAEQPDLPDQLILLSANTRVEGLGPEPKLFIASEDEAVAEVAVELADSAPGEDNAVELLPGSAHAQHLFDTEQADRVLELVLERLAQAS